MGEAEKENGKNNTARRKMTPEEEANLLREHAQYIRGYAKHMANKTGKPPTKEELIAQTRTFTKDYFRRYAEEPGKITAPELERIFEKEMAMAEEKAREESLRNMQARRAAEFDANMEKFRIGTLLKKKRAIVRG